MDDNEIRRQRLAAWLKWGLGMVGAVIVSPFVFLAVKGIVGLAIAAAVGFVVVQLAPVFATMIANWRIKLLVAEVEANPIETMHNLYIEKTKELERADVNIVEFETEIGNFEGQLGAFKEQYPAEAASYQALDDKMRSALADMKTQQSEARRALVDFNLKIRKAEAIYKMAAAAQRVTQLSRSAEAQVFAQIKEQVAFDSVRSQLNRSFASLNLALERRLDAQAIMAQGKQHAGPSTMLSGAVTERKP
jgi:hypothetical protein